MLNADRAAVQVIDRVLNRHGIRIEQIFLFGSRARGEARPDSDWDLYVLIDGDLSFPQRHQLITEIKRELARLGIPNDVILRSARQFHQTKEYPGHLAYDVAREGVPML